LNNEENENSQGLSRMQIIELERQSYLADDTSIGEQCSICLDEIEAGSSILKLSCEHVYHSACIIRWYTENNTCPICRTIDENSEHELPHMSVQFPYEQLYMLTSQISVTLVYPNSARHVTNWNLQTTIIELLQYLDKSCNNQNSNIMLRNGTMIFKTTESFSYLNQPLISFNIRNSVEFIISFF
jgi:hypothetical protein